MRKKSDGTGVVALFLLMFHLEWMDLTVILRPFLALGPFPSGINRKLLVVPLLTSSPAVAPAAVSTNSKSMNFSSGGGGPLVATACIGVALYFFLADVLALAVRFLFVDIVVVASAHVVVVPTDPDSTGRQLSERSEAQGS